MCCRPDGPAEITACAVAVLRARAIVYSDGIVRWLGVHWYGYPYPLRVLLWLKYRDRWTWAKVRQLPGCGCIVALKDRWNGVRQWAANFASQSDLFLS